MLPAPQEEQVAPDAGEAAVGDTGSPRADVVVPQVRGRLVGQRAHGILGHELERRGGIGNLARENPSGGFGELDKVAFMHRLEAVLLLSYEQIAITEQSPLSLLDLTIVGAYVVPGHHNDVQTRLTATAVHIPSRRYLLSADGIHESTQESTLMHASAQIRNAMEEGMLGAAADLDPNLHLALASLRRDIAADRSFEVKGGSVSLLMTLCGMLLLGLRRCTVR